MGDAVQDESPRSSLVEDLSDEEILSGEQPVVQETSEHEFLQPDPEEDAHIAIPESLAVTSTILCMISSLLYSKYSLSFQLKSLL